MAGNLIFDQRVEMDYQNVLVYISEYLAGYGIPSDYMEIDTNALGNMLDNMRHPFPCNNGLEGASPFKKAAQFVCHFIDVNPLKKHLTADMVGRDLDAIRNNQNAILALEIAIEALHGATLNRASDDAKVLSNRISLSSHSYIDIVQALSSVSAVAHFQLLSVLFEQLAYKVNPDCQYELMPH